ncbi:MAG: T9SS type A sorting domain-containing protein [Dyadobacter sp.]|uniref:T9SS type A sorting domain-containing protein n=1 Tax=Dyadobacter sp. TaxID=1914288 RepID=UPI0032652FC8
MKNAKFTSYLKRQFASHNGCQKLFMLAFLWCSFSIAFAQSTDKFFGMNYWEYQTYTNGVTVDKFAENMAETSTWNCSIVRVGGNFPNVSKNTAADRDWYVTAINNIKSMNLIPLVQLPIDLTATETAQWMDYFNVTKNLGIVYWGIGNEPDPSSNWDGWYAGTAYQDGYNYTGWKGQFRTIAKAIKAKDANSIVCGPDFRHWWGTATTGPLGQWYKDFLYGASGVGTDTYNGDPIVDIFAFHFYGDANEGTMIGRYAILKSMIDATNAQRPANQPLKIAVGEYNTEVSVDPGIFSAGQYMAIMAKQALANGAVYFTPWSVEEGNKFRMLESNGTLRSTAHHMKMLSQNKRGTYMQGQINDNNTYNIMEFGMQDANGYTIMLMNKSSTDYPFSVKFSTTNGSYSAANTPLKFRFNASKNIDFSNLILYKNATLLFSFDAAGNMLKKIEYRSGYTAPVTTNYPVANPAPSVSLLASATNVTYGTPIALTANATDTAPGTVSSVSYYDGATLLGTATTSPYTFNWANASVGMHNVTARATDNGGAFTTSTAISITVTSAASDPLTLSYFHVVNKWSADYLRPKDGLATSLIVQDAEATVPALSSFQWEFIAAPTAGYYHIVNKYTGYAIQPTNGSVADNATLSQVALTTSNAGNTELHWVIEASNESPYYWIKNRKSGLYIRPAGGSIDDLINIVQNPLNTTYSSFKWNLADQGPRSGASARHAASSLSQEEFSDEVRAMVIYPNPSADMITVTTQLDAQSPVSVAIYNVSGGKVLSKEFTNGKDLFEERFDISSLPSGVFILKVRNGNRIVSKKFVKKINAPQ